MAGAECRLSDGYCGQPRRQEGNRHDQSRRAQHGLPGHRLGHPGPRCRRRQRRLPAGGGLRRRAHAAVCRWPGRSASRADRQARIVASSDLKGRRMSDRHFKFWPAHAMHTLAAPATNLFYNAEVSARRYPDRPFLVFYDTAVTFGEFLDEAERVAGFLERQCGVRKGDRVLLLMQNSPQFVIGYYGILRANAVVVPLNPMNLTQELLRFAQDAGASTAIVSQELYARVEPLLESSILKAVIVAAYSDYLTQPTTLAVPYFLAAPRLELAGPNLTPARDGRAA